MLFPWAHVYLGLLPKTSFVTLVPPNKPSVIFSFLVPWHNKFGLISVPTSAFPILSLFPRPCFLGRRAAPDFLDASSDTVSRPVMRWQFTLCGLFIVRRSMTVFLLRVLRSRPASVSSSIATFRPYVPLVLFAASVPPLPFPLFLIVHS